MDTRRIRVLLIEDNPGDARLLKEALVDAGADQFEVAFADTLRKGLDYVSSQDVDVVLLDLTLPDGQGLETFVRLHSRVPTVPVVVLTGLDDERLARQAVQKGAQDYLVKGEVAGNLLVRSILYAVERSRAEVLSQLALRAEHQTTKEILELAPIGIVRLDNGLIITEVNQTFCRLVSRTPDAMVGRPLFEVLPHLSRHPFEESVYQGLPYRRENNRMVLPDQQDKTDTYWDLIIWPVKGVDSKIRGSVLVAVDVSERVKVVQQREDFMATLAHDLKTPLIGADRAFGLLLDGVVGKLDKSQSQIITMVKQSNGNLLRMVQNLLEVYRYEASAQTLTFEDVDIVSVINGVVRELAHLSDSRKLIVSVVKDEHVNNISGDQIALRRLIFNLLDNAIKFTGPGGTIELSAENQDDNVVVSVKDSGKGIAPEDLPKLFQRFWQGDPGKQYSVGTGLGLYLCRQIVEAHFGKIECKSAQDQGTIFSITLPARLILDA